MDGTSYERFQGMFWGCAIAEADHTPASSLTHQLIQQGQQVERITFYKNRRTEITGIPLLADTILVSVMYHDSPSERLQALANPSPGLLFLSEAIATRLQHQMPNFEDEPALVASIRNAIQQHLPLQEAAQILLSFPGLSALDQSIVLALYCWLCTPHQFTLSVGRSHQLPQLFPQMSSVQLVPAITGLIAGGSVGHGELSHHEGLDAERLTQTVDHLYRIWAGMTEGPSHVPALDETVISPLGQLKPRTAAHITFKSDYD